MNIELYINSKLVDLGSDISIPLTIQIDDIRTPSTINTTHSKTVSLPSTKNNDIVFGNLYRTDNIHSNFDPYSLIKYELRNNNEILQSGYVEFGDITIDNNDQKKYNINLMSDEAGFYYALANTKLVDVPYLLSGNETLSHTINRTFLSSNWTSSNYGSDTIHDYLRYVPMFQGIYKDFDNKKYKNSGGTTFSNNYDIDEWSQKMFSSYRQTPSIRIKKTFEAIQSYFSALGYVIDFTDDFFSSAYFTDTWLTMQSYSENKAMVYKSSSIIAAFPSDFSIFANSISNIFDSIGIYSSPPSIKFTSDMIGQTNKINVVGYIRIAIKLDVTCMSGGTVTLPSDCTATVKNEFSQISLSSPLNYDLNELFIEGYCAAGSDIVYLDQLYIEGSGFWTPTDTVNHTTIFSLDTNLRGKSFSIGEDSYTIVYAGATQSSIINILFEQETSTIVSSNTTITKLNFIPENLTVKDIFLEFFRMFNLYITVQDGTVYIKSMWNFYGGSTPKYNDWSTKIDLNKDRTLNVVTFDKLRYILGYKEDTSNQFLKQYKDLTKYNYGDKVFETVIKKSNDENRILDKTIFNPILLIGQSLYNYLGVYQQNVTKLCNFSFTNGISRESKHSSMNLVFYKNFDTSYTNYYIFDDDSSITDKQYYSMANSIIKSLGIPNFTTIKDSHSLDFDKPSIYWFSEAIAYPANTISSQYWDNYIFDRFSPNTKILKAAFYLSPHEINRFDFSRFIFYDNRIWLVNKIIDFDPTKVDSTQVELILVNDITKYTTTTAV